MDGIFLRKKFNIWLFLLFLCGLTFIGIYIFLNMVDPTATNELLTFLMTGILICLVVIPSWLLNMGAFIHINEDFIHAKYHWFGKLRCSLSDIAFAKAQGNALILQLKNGKTHTITGLQNAWALAAYIRPKMDFQIAEAPEMLLEKMNGLKTTKKAGLVYVCVGIALMFLNIFITVFLTGERELHEFSQTDWLIFAIMGVVEAATVIATFYFTQKTGKYTLPIEKLQYAIRRKTIESKPLLPGNVIQVFTDDNYTGRILLFGYPNEASVYYIVQEFTADFTFIKVYESKIFESIEQLPANFESLIDITELFFRNHQRS